MRGSCRKRSLDPEPGRRDQRAALLPPLTNETTPDRASCHFLHCLILLLNFSGCLNPEEVSTSSLELVANALYPVLNYKLQIYFLNATRPVDLRYHASEKIFYL